MISRWQSMENEAQLLIQKRLKIKDKQRADQLADRVIKECRPLIEKHAKRYAETNKRWLSDLREEARLGLLYALSRFDGRPGIIFTRYAARSIHWRLRSYLRRQRAATILLAGAFSEIETGRSENDHEGDPGLFYGTATGEVFRWATLMAPLSRAERSHVLSHLRGEPAQGRYSLLSRARQTWRDLGWAACLADPDGEFTQSEERQLQYDLASSDRMVRENAAFAIWVIHAVPSVARRSGCIDHIGLARNVLDRYIDTRDNMLQRVAIDIGWNAIPDNLIAQSRLIPHVRHMMGSTFARSNVSVWDQLYPTLCDTSMSINIGESNRKELFFGWDLTFGLASSLPVLSGVSAALASERSLRGIGGLLRASALLRTGKVMGLEYYLEAVASLSGSRQSGLKTAIRGELENRSSHPRTLLRRRIATWAVGLLPAYERLDFLRLSFDDELFVRHSALSILQRLIREMSPDRLERERWCKAIDEELVRVSNARGPTKPTEYLHLDLETLVMLQPSWATVRCEQIAAQDDGDPELRGHALGWLGVLWKERHWDPFNWELPSRRLIDYLFGFLKAHRDYASHVAQALIAPIAGENRIYTHQDYGILPGYSTPLWRTHDSRTAALS